MTDSSGADRGVLVIGGAGGIGTPLCRRLAASGVAVTIAGRDEEPAARLAQEIGGHSVAMDARDPGSVASGVESAVSKMGGLTGVVNLAGSILLKPAHATKDDEFRDVLEQNLFSSFYAVREAVKVMSRSGGGSIVLLASAVAMHGFAAHEAIAAAKAGVVGLARSAAASYASRGVRVNCVAPGLTDTPMAASIVASEPALKASLAMTPNHQLGAPEHVAATIAFLLSDEASHILGQVIAVDGGMSAVQAK